MSKRSESLEARRARVHGVLGGWPIAVRSAELTAGTLVRCGPGLRGAAWPEDPEQRRLALVATLGPRLMPVRLTAAWVWGCIREPGSQLQASAPRGGRLLERGSPVRRPDLLRVHEYRYTELDLTECAGLQITTPERTAFDVLRLEPRFSARERAACRLLLMIAGCGPDELREQLLTKRWCGRQRAFERLAAL